MTEAKFQELYKKLNSAQREAVDTIEGPVMVIAGPGTGKTQILSLRIANILKKTDVPPDAILALTFTESGVYSMRRRLVEIIGSRAYKINIYTFHSFANELIKRYPEYFEKIIGFSNIDEIEQIKLFEEIIDSLNLKNLKPYGDAYFYLRPLSSIVQSLKREDIDPKELAKIIKIQEEEFAKIPDLYHENGRHKGLMKGKYSDLSKKIEKNKELLKIYKNYQEKLHERGLYDYDDMIMEVLRVLEKDKDLLLKLQEEYQYILADEHQDTNKAQNRLLELLSDFHENPNLFVVGDEKQAIFRFQGASLENFLYFKKKYKSAKLINLTDNYRSPQTILDASHSLISNTSGESIIERPRLISKTKEALDNIKIHSFKNIESEHLFIAKDILRKIKSEKINPAQIAVFYRSNKEAMPISKVFENLRIPFVIESDQDILSDENIAKFILILRAVNHPADDTLMAELLFLDVFQIPITDSIKVARYAGYKKISILEALENSKSYSAHGLQGKKSLKSFYNKIISWSSFAKNRNLVDTLEVISRESSLLEKILKEGIESLRKLDIFFDFAKNISSSKKFPKLADLVEYIELVEKHSIKIRGADTGITEESVRLMTAHRSKGLEFDYVYIVGLNDKNWGNRKEIRYFHLPIKGLMSEGFDQNDDERRLFYVALTRAKKELSLSYPSENNESGVLLPSQFIEEISQDFRHHEDHMEENLKITGKKYSTLPPKERTPKIKDKKFLNNLFLEEGLSISAINNYLKCPWQYFFENLVRLPKAQNKYQSYGTAVHNALSEMFSINKRGKKINSRMFLKSFQNHLSRQILTEGEFQELFQKGKGSLVGFFDYFKKRINKDSFSEYKIAGVYVGIKANVENKNNPKIMTRGRLDLIEFNKEGSVNVADFKTSKPKTRNEILGKTKKDDKSIWRQLVFYKLLLEDNEEKIFQMDKGKVIFTEPDEKGRYHEEVFEVSEEDKKEMRELVGEVAGEIYSLSFWDKKCSQKDCEYCRLSESIR